MTNDIKKLAQALPKMPSTATTMASLVEAVERLSNMVSMLMLEKQLSDLTSKVESITGVKTQTVKNDNNSKDLSNLLDNLEEVTTTRRLKDGKREFLLHRLTENFEYQDAKKINEYITKQPTDWSVEIGVASLEQDRSEETLKGANPVVSCFVHEDCVVGISGAQENTGTWGDMGQSPHKNKFLVKVRPGKYEMYQEISQ
jgi:hypothetical protein